ncbi:winged helix-turn-helix domain-containing protein [Rhodopirellula halodulae]|uniref:winged helix-turn-helix domain-containing protein n=1 Tax=Rhodopirellula halodulae TaxID=2894198 RepID=UPI001E64A11F|nr:winged helix-turn-helix domain-containing protein [Rhodopirellula sp. JC737]MCC9654647.1 winged helix-turn-helix domain-containing protein [Rhodopirellula sp. JC737]
MKKADVKIGGEYYAKVTNKKVVVRIDAENASGGWDATNLTTNKKVRIKTAGRLQGLARTTESTAEPAARAKKRVTKKKSDTNTAGEKKLSCVKAALQVLESAGEPMNTQEMIVAMVDQNLWESPGGKTPHATLYSAILRDLAKGEESRFVKTERGRFTVRS